MKPLVIYGAGGHAREMLQMVRDCNRTEATWDVLGFCSDDAAQHGRTVAGLAVRAWTDWTAPGAPRPYTLLAIGRSADRRRVALRIRDTTAGFPTIVHPSVLTGERVALGEGVQIAAGCILTVDIAVGEFALINRSVNVSHDVVVEAFASIHPMCALAGNVVVATGAELGTGTITIPGVRVGEWSVVGAGAVVTRDVPPDVTVAGVPARVIKRMEPGWHTAQER